MCNYLNTMAEARTMMERLALPGVRLLADLYHMETQGEDWRELGAYLPDVRHVHVSTVGRALPVDCTARAMRTPALRRSAPSGPPDTAAPSASSRMPGR